MAVLATKKRRSVDDVLKSASSLVKKTFKSWYDRLPDEDKKWCDRLKAEVLSGKYAHLSSEALSKVISNELGVSVTAQALRNWLRK